jgi:hypothetical protein
MMSMCGGRSKNSKLAAEWHWGLAKGLKLGHTEFMESATPTTYQRAFLFTILASENYFVGVELNNKKGKIVIFLRFVGVKD